MADMHKQMETILCNALHYDFDEEACVSTLNIEKTASNLLSHGVLLPAPEKFVFREGCLPRKDFCRLVGACKNIGNFVWDAPTHGFTEEETDYIPIDLMVDPDEIEAALRTVLTLLRPTKKETG